MGYSGSIDRSSSPLEAAGEGASWFPVEQTHAIQLSPRSRVVLHSGGLGWRNAFASITSGRVWSARTPAIEHASFAYCLRGLNVVERTIEGEGVKETVLFRPRQLGILPTHAPAYYKVTGGADVLLVYLRASVVRDIARTLGLASGTSLHFQPRMGFLDPLLEQLCLACVAALHRQDPVQDPSYVDQLAIMAAAHCLRNYRLTGALEHAEAPTSALLTSLGAVVHRVCGFIDAHLDGDLSLETLAREAKISPAALTQAFAETHGATPHQHVIQRRVERARTLLMNSSLPLSEIALQTGFASQSHFSVVFKRVTSLTPNAFRRGP